MMRMVIMFMVTVAALAPCAAASQDATARDPVAEALFLHDCLPPGGRDVALSLGIQRRDTDPTTGERGIETSPRVQFAMALGDRLGFTAEVGVEGPGGTMETPGASLKVLLRAPVAGRTGFAASFDLFGGTHSLVDTETGVGLGAIRALGGVTFRGAATVATGISRWSPHLHAGLSAALELGSRWRALGEVVAEVAGGEVAVSAGPSFKVALGEATTLMAGALFRVAPDRAEPVVTLQLAQSI